MKFQVNIEVDETNVNATRSEIIDFTLNSLSALYESMDTYYDIGVMVDNIVSGLTS